MYHNKEYLIFVFNLNLSFYYTYHGVNKILPYRCCNIIYQYFSLTNYVKKSGLRLQNPVKSTDKKIPSPRRESTELIQDGTG